MFRHSFIKKVICISLAGLLIVTNLLPLSNNDKSYAESSSDGDEVLSQFDDDIFSARDDIYSSYLDVHKEFPRPQQEIMIQGEDYTNTIDMNVEVVEIEEGQAVETDEIGTIEWEVDVPEEGLYNIGIRYYPIEGKSSSIERKILLNGELPFQGASTLTFPRIWTNELDEIERDNRGNDLRPKQIESPMWFETEFKDAEGYYTEPYLFYFEEGINTISFVSSREPMLIDYLKVFQTEEVPTYEEVKQHYDEMGYQEVTNQEIKVQGESATLKSDPTLYAISDRSSPATEPYDVSKIRMNGIGGYNWRWPGQWITWDIDVPEDGLYKIAIKNRQNTLRGVYSTRKVMINGELPFSEMENTEFFYDNNWQMEVLGGEEDPYLFYLTEGTHELTMEVTLGNLAPLLRAVESSVLELNRIYRQILMITGPNPDPYRDYLLDRNIPEMLDVFRNQSNNLRGVADELVRLTGETSDQTEILNTMVIQLEDFIKKPETIQRRLDRYKINVGSLGTWILTIREQPLEIDYLMVASPDADLPKADASFVRKVAHEIGAFFYSFFEDYDSIGDVAEDGEEAVTVWIGTGRDQAQVLKSMIDETFTPETGINVNLQLVQMANLLPATLANQGPDVAMQVGNEIPVNYAMRNAVVDLAQFADYEEIEPRFRDSAVLPYRFDGGVYGLPEQQVFSMLFYRKDIFDELEIEVPQTWDEFLDLIPDLQKNHMEIALPLLQNPQNPGQAANLVPNQTFTMMLYQEDGELYQNDAKESALDSPIGLEVFDRWTSLYTNYKLPLQYDFANRFRTGEMPIGIENYTFYNHLSVSAPEIRGLWEFVPVPGTVQPDGSIRRDVGSSGSAAIIMENSENKDASWEFLKWWTSTDIQIKFGREMEGLMGAAARYPTANIDALAELPWPIEDYKRLAEQWEWVEGVPQVPGGYFTGRHLDNAFREVVNEGTNSREAMNDYVIFINDEIRLKRREFGLPIE